jgi:hypothetical protein
LLVSNAGISEQLQIPLCPALSGCVRYQLVDAGQTAEADTRAQRSVLPALAATLEAAVLTVITILVWLPGLFHAGAGRPQ